MIVLLLTKRDLLIIRGIKKNYKNFHYMKTTKQRLMELAGMLTEETKYTFSGDKAFMDGKAVNVFKKYGFDKSVLNREYDPNEGIVEFTVTMRGTSTYDDSTLLSKIETELESIDRGQGLYGGYFEI